jgi:hypothetical protein
MLVFKIKLIAFKIMQNENLIWKFFMSLTTGPAIGCQSSTDFHLLEFLQNLSIARKLKVTGWRVEMLGIS